MTGTIVEILARQAARVSFDELPQTVVTECKRILIDSIGCALAAIGQPKGKAGIEYGKLIGGGSAEASIMGTRDRVSVFGASFANAETMNGMDMDAILPPGHVTALVLPPILAVGEARGSNGRQVLAAIATSHEFGYRFSRAIDSLRDTEDGKVSTPAVLGFSTGIFGTTAAIGMLRGQSERTLAHSLGIAGCVTPVNSQGAWLKHTPPTSIKYLLAGALGQAAFTAAHMAELGHRGDLLILDDREFGFPRFIGTRRWAPDHITEGLGEDWLFPDHQSYKPYPHCRLFNGLIECVLDIVEPEDIRPDEISKIVAYVEGIADQPVWMNRQVELSTDAQFSAAHGVAVAVHRRPPGKEWLESDFILSPSVMGLMEKVEVRLHPDYVRLLSEHGSSRPAKIELTARGRTFVSERRYPKGSPSPDPDTYMTMDELVRKFRANAAGVIPDENIDMIAERVLELENVHDFGTIMKLTQPN